MKIQNKKLDKLVEQRLVSVQKHPTADLWIYNYTEKAQFDHVWNPDTMMCRGLIVDGKNNIVARPFKKFFNLDELSSPYVPEINLKQPFDVYEKMDGSLGIMYFLEGKPYIATRGSFVSDQAIEANKILQEQYNGFTFNPEHTYLFEIVFPENRIVINYGKTRDLYLLAVIETATGRELTNTDGPFPTPKYYDYKDLEKIQKMMERRDTGDEGFVIRFKDGNRAKIKYNEYKRLHKLITGINARRIWEVLMGGGNMQDLCKAVPDEFYEWVQKASQEIKKQYRDIEKEALETFGKIDKGVTSGMSFRETRKAYAKEIMKYLKLSAIMFKLLDGQPYSDIIWKMIKPKSERPFRQQQNEEI
jgi:RNA ligase